MIITENAKKWSQIINEELGVQDKNKLNWMSQYAQNHEVFEGLQVANPDPAAGIYATPLNTMGMGNPMMPQVAAVNGADFHNHGYVKGSGDVPMSTLTMSLEVAAMTIGLELVPVVPMNGPWAMLSYMDFPYAGGKLGRVNETAMDGKGEKDAIPRQDQVFVPLKMECLMELDLFYFQQNSCSMAPIHHQHSWL